MTSSNTMLTPNSSPPVDCRGRDLDVEPHVSVPSRPNSDVALEEQAGARGSPGRSASAARAADTRPRGPAAAGRCRSAQDRRERAPRWLASARRPSGSTTICADGPLSKRDSRSLRLRPRGKRGDRRQLGPAGARGRRCRDSSVKTRDASGLRAEEARLGEERLGLAEEEEPAGFEREVRSSRGSVCCASAPKYMSVLRETSRSTREIGGSCRRSLRPKMTARRRSLRTVDRLLPSRSNSARRFSGTSIDRLRVVAREPARGRARRRRRRWRRS